MNDTPIVILGIDCETDVGSFYYTYNGLVNGTPLLLEVFRERGIEATFFFTGAAAREHPEVVRQVREAGHEVGCHSVYHETVGEAIFDVPGVMPLLPEEVDHRLEVATEWVAAAAGERPVSFRAPRLFGGTRMVNALERLGYLADASYPLYYYQQRLVPYHPSPDDWTQEGDMRILEIPNFADLTIESKDPYGRDRDQWPLFRTEGADALLRHIDNFIGFVQARGLRPVLCFYFHPWEFVEQPPSMHIGEGTVIPDEFIIKNCGPFAVEQFCRLLDALVSRGCQFMSCRRLAEPWSG
ncbi:MAG: polysaccharide deacetylase family protein [Armatimonadetes bacterium]|nr:polysaccharide deacetylase family protein [Armatimonadota bacterium]